MRPLFVLHILIFPINKIIHYILAITEQPLRKSIIINLFDLDNLLRLVPQNILHFHHLR